MSVNALQLVSRSALVALAAAISASACGDAVSPVCPGDIVTVTASSGTTPEFTWTPACPVAQLDVDDMTQGGVNVWRISGQGTNAIAPGLRYGETPTGVVQLRAPDPLVAGREYRLTVLRWVGDAQSGGLAGGGVARFTP